MRGQATIYWRDRGGVKRAYADLRAYADVGGRQEALVAPSEKLATTDPATAQELLARRIRELDAKRRGRALHGETERVTLADCARDYLVAKAGEINPKTGEPVTEQWMEGEELRLRRAITHFGQDRALDAIDVGSAREFDAGLRVQGPLWPALSGGTRRQHLNTLGALYRYAGERQLVPPGYNPIAAWRKKPTARRLEARWLEVHDAALLLEAARIYRPAHPEGGRPPITFAHELLATLLLTGGRESEVLGLEVDDVSLERGVVTFRPNAWRRLKTATSHRSVPLWPQLREILRAYFPRREREGGALLFPSCRTGKEAMVTDFRKVLDAIGGRAGWASGEVRSKMFRHTYCAARLQTLDQGAAVSPFTVAREMGHGGTRLVHQVYGHLGTVRHRARVVEYRVAQHRAKLGDRLKALRAGL
jgi:integrase